MNLSPRAQTRKCSYCRRFVWLSQDRRFCHTCWWGLTPGLRQRLAELCTKRDRPFFEDLQPLLQEAFKQLQVEPKSEES